MDLTITDDAWAPTDDGRLVASVSVNGLPCLAEAFPAGGERAELALLHAASHADGPFQTVPIRGGRYVVVVLPHA